MTIGRWVVAPLRFAVLNLVNRRRASPRHPWRWCAFVLVDALMRAFPARGPQSGTLVVLVNRLGDAIVSRPLVRELQVRFAGEGPFLVVGDESWRCLSDNLYADIPTSYIDENRYTRSLRYRIAVNRRIAAARFERAICFMHHRLEIRDDALVYATGAPVTIVSSLPFYHLRWYPWLLDHYLGTMSRVVESLPPYLAAHQQVPPDGCDYPRRVPHVIQRQRAFAAALGLDLVHQPSPIDQPRDRTVLLNFGAKDTARQWPIAEWAALAVSIATLGFEPCFVGGPAEVGRLDEIRRAVRAADASDSVIRTLIHEVPFGDLIEVFTRAACYIGPDTGTSHLAVHCGTPTVAILLRPAEPEDGDRFGDFFPYPDGYLASPYRSVCTTKAEFRCSGAGAPLRAAVFSAFVDVVGAPRPRRCSDLM